MGVSTSLYSGLSGLIAHQRRMDAIGNNIANVNTPGYKSSRVLFRTAFSQTMSIGTAPSGGMGGVNPVQVGLGTIVGATSTNFAPGSIESTGVQSDVAISGGGFFVVKDSGGSSYFTRDGSFNLGADQVLTNSKGMIVQGWMADKDFNVSATGTTTPITIELGSLNLAKATQNFSLTGQLDADSAAATQGSVNATQAFNDSSTAASATAGSLLTNLRNVASATQLFAVGDVITLSGSKGGRNLTSDTFTVTAASTLGGLNPATSLSAWLQDKLGISTAAGVPGTPGITIGANGAVTVTGNEGTANDIANLMLASSGATAQPFTITKTQSADGGSAYTHFPVYDSLGTEINVNMTFVHENTTGNTWRWYAESPQNGTDSTVVGTGTVTFDTDGTFLSDSGDQLVISRAGTGAEPLLAVRPDFAGVTQPSLKEGKDSTVALQLQDGAENGTLNDYAIGANGIVTGIFTNGLVATLGQVALATFSNDQGLYSIGDNLYSPGPNAGSPQIGTPGSFGSGTLQAGALEASNVDLANEFVNLIVTQTGYTANSRVISTSNSMLTELLNTVR